MQVQIFSKIWCKTFEKYFLTISPHFLVEDAQTFHLIHELLFYGL